jgi:hypothetical protein
MGCWLWTLLLLQEKTDVDADSLTWRDKCSSSFQDELHMGPVHKTHKALSDISEVSALVSNSYSTLV